MAEIKTRRGILQVSNHAAREVAATKSRKRYTLPESWRDEGVAENMAAYIKRESDRG